jgi:hypothetical protein
MFLRNARNFPLVFGDIVYFETQATSSTAWLASATREEFKAAVAADLGHLLALPGVSAECNHMRFTAE